MLIEPLWNESAPGVIYRSWLDPETGRSLHVEALLAEDPDGFSVAPKRWVEAARPRSRSSK